MFCSNKYRQLYRELHKLNFDSWEAQTMTSSSKLSSSATPQLANPVFSYALLMISFIPPFSQLLELTSRSEQLNKEEVLLNFKCGTLLAKRNLKLLFLHITRELKESSLSSIYVIQIALEMLRIGWQKPSDLAMTKL